MGPVEPFDAPIGAYFVDDRHPRWLYQREHKQLRVIAPAREEGTVQQWVLTEQDSFVYEPFYRVPDDEGCAIHMRLMLYLGSRTIRTAVFHDTMLGQGYVRGSDSKLFYEVMIRPQEFSQRKWSYFDAYMVGHCNVEDFAAHNVELRNNVWIVYPEDSEVHNILATAKSMALLGAGTAAYNYMHDYFQDRRP